VWILKSAPYFFRFGLIGGIFFVPKFWWAAQVVTDIILVLARCAQQELTQLEGLLPVLLLWQVWFQIVVGILWFSNLVQAITNPWLVPARTLWPAPTQQLLELRIVTKQELVSCVVVLTFLIE
jgi:hypothetical protein